MGGALFGGFHKLTCAGFGFEHPCGHPPPCGQALPFT
jgi:hypothetical protein